MDEIASEESRALLDTRVAEIELPSETPSQLDIYLSNVQNRNLYLAVFTAVLGPLSFGFVLGYSSPSIPELKQSSNPELRLDNNQASWFGSVVTLGAAAGGILGGYVVDKVGRKLSLMSCAVPFVVGFLAIVCAQNIWMLYTGRLLTGLASGVTSLVVPVYISEVAHSRVRGMLGSCVQLMVVTGILGAYLAGMALEWRWLAVLCSVPPSVMICLMVFMPETPRFLLSRSHYSEARTALQFLRGPLLDHDWECRETEGNAGEQVNQDGAPVLAAGGPEATRESHDSPPCSRRLAPQQSLPGTPNTQRFAPAADLLPRVRSPVQQELSVAELKNPAIHKPFLIGMALMSFQQASGINAIMFYAETIFEDANFK
ncbi:hypothetical protein lerEdw1_020172, partial [Lerista edwardsae]